MDFFESEDTTMLSGTLPICHHFRPVSVKSLLTRLGLDSSQFTVQNRELWAERSHPGVLPAEPPPSCPSAENSLSPQETATLARPTSALEERRLWEDRCSQTDYASTQNTEQGVGKPTQPTLARTLPMAPISGFLLCLNDKRYLSTRTKCMMKQNQKKKKQFSF